MPPMAAPIHRARFEDLPRRALYDILRLRAEVFVVEQDCVFSDPDGRDHEPACEHLWIADEDSVVAALRCLDEGGGVWSIGRIVCRVDARSSGTASHLVRAGIDHVHALGATRVVIGAQAQLLDWYRRFGFEVSGPRYLEDGILHVPMALGSEVAA